VLEHGALLIGLNVFTLQSIKRITPGELIRALTRLSEFIFRNF
jgi:hypothetical protein